MSGYLPDGCTQEDCDRAAGGYDPPDCLKCGQSPCECCRECGAGPEQACEPWCGLPHCYVCGGFGQCLEWCEESKTGNAR